MKLSQFWQDRADGKPLGPRWLVGNVDIRRKVYEGGDDLTLAEWMQLPMSVRRVLEQQYERAA